MNTPNSPVSLSTPWKIPYAHYGWFIITWLAVLTLFHNVQFITTDMTRFDPDFREKYTLHWPMVMTHGVTAMLALAIGPLQFLEFLRKRERSMHRILGRIYILSIALAAPTGFLMGMMAHGGILSQSAFMLFAVLWLFTAYKGYETARKRNFTSHRVWMIRSYALTFAAVILRIQLNLLLDFGFRYDDVYPYLPWSSWLPTLLLGEAIIRRWNVYLPQPVPLIKTA
jgi:uncharacterized membrane protein